MITTALIKAAINPTLISDHLQTSPMDFLEHMGESL